MKKSHLILLLCLLLCGQMFAQRPTPSTPANPKNPDAPTMTGGIEPCVDVSYEIAIDGIVWDTNSENLEGIIPDDYPLANDSDLPEGTFNLVKLSLKHPSEFSSYKFELSVQQSGSTNPVVVLFVGTNNIEITSGTVLQVEVIGNGSDGGGVSTTATVENVGGGGNGKCIGVSTLGKQLIFGNGDVCIPNDSSYPCGDYPLSGQSSKW